MKNHFTYDYCKKTIYFLLLYFALLATGYSTCFQDHIYEAIKINKQRKILYEEATDGKTSKISSTLIFLERMTIPVAKFLDFRAEKWRRYGIPLLCDEFVSMDDIPEFSAVNPEPVKPITEYKKLNTRQHKKMLELALESKGFSGLGKQAKLILEEINNLSEYYCMYRHVIESIIRAAYYGDVHINQALKQGVESPHKISKLFLKLQISSLNFAAYLDDQSALIHSEKIPIVCNDIPQIPEE